MPETDDERESIADVSHTNPYTGETLGEAFRRGPAVSDGGGEGSDRDRARSASTMADVDHTQPNADINDVWARGHRRRSLRTDDLGDE